MGNARLLNKSNHEEIALRAYHLWEKGGRQPGRDREYWLQAEADLMAACQAGADPTPESHHSPKPAPSVKLPMKPQAEPKVSYSTPTQVPVQIRSQKANAESRHPKARAA